MRSPYLVGLLLIATTSEAAEPEPLRLPVTRDTWFSNSGPEADGNNGGAPQIKLKSHQEMSLVDVDPAPLRGKTVRSATLHLKRSAEPVLRRVTVGSIGAEWVEGTGRGYETQPGSSTHNSRKHPDVPWSFAGSDLCSIILGQGGTTWRMADATPPDAAGWQRVAVDPAIVAARVAGISHGLFLFDDTGTEWTRRGESFQLHPFPNRFARSREAGPADAPYLTVAPGPADLKPPAAPAEPRTEPADDLPAGEAMLSWTTPSDAGPSGTIGFFARVDGREIPRYLIPLAGSPGTRVRMHMRDLNLAAGATVRVEVRAVDGAGNIGPAAAFPVRVSSRVAGRLPGEAPTFATKVGPLPKLGAAEVAILDELDKVHPVTGATIPAQDAAYFSANHLWSARGRALRLHAARNEFVAFQVLIRGDAADVRPSIAFADGSKIGVEFGRYHDVATSQGPLPDPIVPLDAPALDNTPGRTSRSLHGEVYVPHDTPPGEHKGTLTLRSGNASLAIDVSLTIWDFTLPDALSFLPEMNCYGLPENERDFYRLAHRHRTVLNRVPYHQNGAMSPGLAPAWDGRTLDWKAWDRRFGPLFDGSAFADSPRRGVPIECFYLPMHENWPTPIEGSYNGDYWADRAFPDAYRGRLVEVSRQMAAHFHERGWAGTLFQFFLNGKNDFKTQGWSRGSSPWLLDEPASFQDFWALRYFGAAFHEGVGRAKGPAKLAFRCDISRPQWQRDALDGLLDYNVVGGAFRQYRRMVLDRKRAFGQVVAEYGGTNPVEAANVQPVGWSLDAWTLGADGVLPWQTVGSDESWTKADELSLFYPGAGPGRPGVTPSIRLKAYRRGQQDVEYLTLWSRLKGEPRWAIRQALRDALRLSGERHGTGVVAVEDAGRIDYARLLPQDLWKLRVRLGRSLADLHPRPRRQLVDFRTPPRDPARLAPRLVGETAAKRADSAPRTALVEKVIQGRPAVRDALIDPDRPDQKLGAVARDNAIRKAGTTSAFLVRFDLDLPKGAVVESATLRLAIWDPSSEGRTKLAAFPVATPWDEASATWLQPADARRWKSGGPFTLGVDTGPPGPFTIVEPDQGSDLADPPRECDLDVTEAVRSWLDGTRPNHGLAIVPIADRAIDGGQFTRIQVFGSEYDKIPLTPRLLVRIRP